MSSDEVNAENKPLFLYTWKLERMFSFASSSEKLWEYSTVFSARGYSWKLALNLGKVDVKDGKSYLSLFLALLDAASPLPLHIKVIVESSIIDEKCSQCNKRKVSHRFQQSKSEGCLPYLISLETLECPSSGFLVVEIIDVVMHSEKNASLSPKPEDSSLGYTWKINGFSKLTEPIYTTGPFLYKDHKWYLRLDLKGDSKENKFVSLYLGLHDASTLASSVKISADYYIDWVDQIKGRNHEHATDSVVFDRKSPAWGWRHFLSLDTLHDPSRGLLVNDTCIIKVGFYKCDVSK